MKESIQRSLATIVNSPIVSDIVRQAIRTLRAPHFMTQRLPVTRSFEFMIGSEKYKYYSSMYDAVGRVLFWQGFDKYEPETFTVFKKLVQQSRTFVDIGANTGIFCVAARTYNKEAEIHAFEPVPAIYDLMTLVLHENGLTNDVKANKIAISNRVGIVPFHIPLNNMSSGSLGQDGPLDLPGRTEDVECTTLDCYVEAKSFTSVDLIKIDVEGFEHLVFEGAAQVLRRFRPTIICECLPGCNVESLEKSLGPIGYKYYLLTDKGPTLCKHIAPDPEIEFKNFLFTTRDLSSIGAI